MSKSIKHDNIVIFDSFYYIFENSQYKEKRTITKIPTLSIFLSAVLWFCFLILILK